MKNFQYLWAVLVLAFQICVLPMHAKGAETPGPDVEKQYRNCPNGYYSGPRPGRIRYTKDPWIWVVTPEFAAKFCMPEEFVSSELKGAEAVAFKLTENHDEISCGWGDKVEVCNIPKSLRFEIYIKSSVKLPKERDVPYFNAATIPSVYLLDSTEKERQARIRGVKTNPHVGAFGVFESSQIGLLGVKDGRVEWPITTLGQEIFYSQVFEGIDLIAVEGLTGFFTNPRMEKQNIRQFVIGFSNLGDYRSSNNKKKLEELAHVIELPEQFTDKIRAADKARGVNYEEFGKRSLGVSVKK